MSAPKNPLPARSALFPQVPRRCLVELLTDEEVMLLDAAWAIEELGADPLLTEVITLLSAARGKLADWLEKTP